MSARYSFNAARWFRAALIGIVCMAGLCAVANAQTTSAPAQGEDTNWLQLTVIDFAFQIWIIAMNIFVGLASVFFTNLTEMVLGIQ
jgi:hypothetical protein